MTTKTGKSLSDSEKRELLSEAIEILTCGDAKIVNAFTAKIEEAMDILRSEKAKPTKKGEVKMRTRSRRDLTDAVDLVSHCASKIEFLVDFFCTGKPDFNFEFSDRGSSGLVFILGDIAEELDFISKKMTEGTGESLQDSIQKARDKGEI